MIESRQVVLLGGGGHAAVVAEAVHARGWSLAGCVDDDSSVATATERVGLPYLGTFARWPEIGRELPAGTIVHAATGSARLRREWLDLISTECAQPIVHPSAVVSRSAAIEIGAFIGPLAAVNARAAVGRGAIVNTGAIVEHDARVGAFAHLAPRSVLAGGAIVDDDALVGCGAIVLPCIRIGRGSTLGAGAVATTDVPAGTVASGVPARVHAASV